MFFLCVKIEIDILVIIMYRLIDGLERKVKLAVALHLLKAIIATTLCIWLICRMSIDSHASAYTVFTCLFCVVIIITSCISIHVCVIHDVVDYCVIIDSLALSIIVIISIIGAVEYNTLTYTYDIVIVVSSWVILSAIIICGLVWLTKECIPQCADCIRRTNDIGIKRYESKYGTVEPAIVVN